MTSELSCFMCYLEGGLPKYIKIGSDIRQTDNNLSHRLGFRAGLGVVGFDTDSE